MGKGGNRLGAFVKYLGTKQFARGSQTEDTH